MTTQDGSEIAAAERKLRDLEVRQHNLVQENNNLKQNLHACESNVQNFVREMNLLLDQHDIGSLVGQALLPDLDFATEGAASGSDPRTSGYNLPQDNNGVQLASGGVST